MRLLSCWPLPGYYFFYFGFLGAFSPYFPLYLQTLSLSPWQIGVLMSQMQLMRLFSPYYWGCLADRSGQRTPIIRTAAIAALICFAFTLFAHDFFSLLGIMAAMAFFWSAALPLVESLTFDFLQDGKGSYSQIRLWGSVGFIVSVLLTGIILDVAPAFILLWVCLFLLGGVLVFSVKIPDCTAQHVILPSTSIKTLLRRGAVRALLLACFAMSVAHGALYVFYSLHLTNHGYDKTSVGLLWSLGVVAEIVVFLLTSRWVTYAGERVVLLCSFGAAVIRFVMIAWGVEWFWVLVLAQLLHGLTFGACHAAAIALVNRWFSGGYQARGQAIYSSLSFGAGGLCGGIISAGSWEIWGPTSTYAMSALFALAGFFLIWRWVRH